MSRVTEGVLKAVIALSVAGSLTVQVVLVPLIWRDLTGEGVLLQWTVALLAVLFVVALQMVAVCVWRLLTLVRRDAVFSERAFRYVNTVIGAMVGASGVVCAFAVLLARGETAPGMVGLVCGAALVLAGVALVVVVMKALLRQAVGMRSELEQVI